MAPFSGSVEEWDAFVRRARHGTFSHLAGWHEIVRDCFGHEIVRAEARCSDGQLLGVLPLVRVRSFLFGDYLISMPFLSYGGPIGSPAAQTTLTSWANSLADELGVDLLELRARHHIDSNLSGSDRKITSILALPDSESDLDGVIPPSRRRQIRRARNEGMQVGFGIGHLEAFYDVFARNMRDLGTPVLPRRFFEDVCRRLEKFVRVGVVFWRDIPVAAGCGFAWRDEFELTWVSSLSQYRGKYPNMLLYRSFMEKAVEEKISHFNFGRSTPGGSTHKFKRQWAATDVALPWLHGSVRGRDAPPSPEAPLYRLATRIWGRVPLPVANRLGPMLSRYLP